MNVQELIDRVEKATGPDQELDAALYRELGGEVPTEFMGTGVKLSWDASGKAWCYLPGGMRVSFTPPALTASIDAALALMEKVLPGWTVQIFKLRSDKGWGARVSSPRYDTFSSFEGEENATEDGFVGQPNGALAIILATLRAISAGGVRGGKAMTR
jgi:hypothetical protein